MILAFVIFSPYGAVNRIQLSQEKNKISDKVNALQRQNDSLRKEIEKLKKDTLEIERVAREKYGLIKQGEKVFFIDENESD